MMVSLINKYCSLASTVSEGPPSLRLHPIAVVSGFISGPKVQDRFELAKESGQVATQKGRKTEIGSGAEAQLSMFLKTSS